MKKTIRNNGTKTVKTVVISETCISKREKKLIAAVNSFMKSAPKRKVSIKEKEKERRV